MARTRPFRTTIVLAALFVTTLTAAGTQNALSQLNLTEADARSTALSSITDGYVQYGVAGRAIKALPASARGPVIAGAIAWARAYVSSPAFAAEYAAYRERQKPQPPEVNGSIDDEFKREIAKQREQIEESRKNIANLPAEMRPEMDAVIQQMEAMLKDPDMLQMMRSGIESNRAEEKSRYESALKDWGESYPVDPKSLVARRLRAFLDVSADVDFAAATVARNGRQVFSEQRYESKPAEWKLCYRAGPEATTAARTAATAWLAALGTP